MNPNNNHNNKEEAVPSSMGEWHVVLLVDSQERCNPKIQFMPHAEIVQEINRQFATANGGNPPACETRSLLAGDYLSVARRKQKRSKGGNEEEEEEERVLDCIIERKSFGDLCLSVTKKSTTCRPLSRMDVQMKKLQATTLSHQGILLEQTDRGRNFRSKLGWQAGQHFLKELGDNKYPGVRLYKTPHVAGTVQFLMERHEEMRNRVRQAYQDALLDPTKQPQEARPPFAPIGTVDQMNQAIHGALQDPAFRYYLQLRRVDKMGDATAQSVIKHYPTEANLQDFLQSTADPKTAIKELAKLPLIGKTLATRLQERFSPVISEEKKAPAVVTPPQEKKKAPSRKRKRTTSSPAAKKELSFVQAATPTNEAIGARAKTKPHAAKRERAAKSKPIGKAEKREPDASPVRTKLPSPQEVIELLDSDDSEDGDNKAALSSSALSRKRRLCMDAGGLRASTGGTKKTTSVQAKKRSTSTVERTSVEETATYSAPKSRKDLTSPASASSEDNPRVNVGTNEELIDDDWRVSDAQDW